MCGTKAQMEIYFLENKKRLSIPEFNFQLNFQLNSDQSNRIWKPILFEIYFC